MGNLVAIGAALLVGLGLFFLIKTLGNKWVGGKKNKILAQLKGRGAFTEAGTHAVFSRGFSIDSEGRQLAIIDLPNVEIFTADQIASWECYRQNQTPPINRAMRPRKSDVLGDAIDRGDSANNGFITFWLGNPKSPREETFDMGPMKNAQAFARHLEKIFPNA